MIAFAIIAAERCISLCGARFNYIGKNNGQQGHGLHADATAVEFGAVKSAEFLAC